MDIWEDTDEYEPDGATLWSLEGEEDDTSLYEEV